MRKKLNSLFVEKVTADDGRMEIFDTTATGLCLRVTPKGTKSWVYVYRIGGRQRKYKIGYFPAWGLAEARKKAGRLAQQVDEGIDPQAAKDALKTMPTVGEVMDDFIKQHVKQLRTGDDTIRILEKDVRPAIGDYFIKDITKSHLLKITTGIVDRGAPIMANRVFEIVRKMFNWAVARDIIPYTPCAGLDRPTAKEIARDRALSNAEIKRFWLRLDDTAMKDCYKLALKFMLMTAQRKGEVMQAHKSEFNLEEKIWIIPATRTKNKKPHLVPLTEKALDLLAQIHKENEESEWLFEAIRNGKSMGKPVRSIAINRYFQEARQIFDIEDFRIHDLRRSAATIMAREGISEFDIGKELNHSSKQVTAIYNRHNYQPEKLAALQVLEQTIRNTVENYEESDNVMSFPNRQVS